MSRLPEIEPEIEKIEFTAEEFYQILLDAGEDEKVKELKRQAELEEIRKAHGEEYLKQYLRKQKLEEMEGEDPTTKTASDEIQRRLNAKRDEKRQHQEWLEWLRGEAIEIFQLQFEQNKRKQIKERFH